MVTLPVPYCTIVKLRQDRETLVGHSRFAIRALRNRLHNIIAGGSETGRRRPGAAGVEYQGRGDRVARAGGENLASHLGPRQGWRPPFP